ncbi:MAG: transglutaminase domain-containing protein [Planctomycetaceae bacterium]
MDGSNHGVPKPHRRLINTWLKRSRDLGRFAPPIAVDRYVVDEADRGLAAEWGQFILLNDVVLALHRDGTVSQRFHVVSLLWGQDDLADWDEVTREFDPRYSLETILRARLHFPDGSTTAAMRSTSHPERHSRLTRLTFSPLRPGVIVEFETQFDRFTPFSVAPGLWAQLLLQGTLPRRRSRLTVAVAKPFHADVRWHHCDWQPRESDESEYSVYCWDLQELSGVKLDPWTPPVLDFLPWVEVSTLASWQPIADHYRAELDPGAASCDSLRQLAASLTAADRSPREKVLSIYRHASQDVRYGRHPRDVARPAARKTGDMLAEMRGDCRDKSAFMVSMLRQLNIPAEIAVVRTRPNGMAPACPAPCFDHAVVRSRLDGEELWLDAAGGPSTFGMLPYNDQGAAALILDDGPPRLTVIPGAAAGQHRIERSCTGHLDRDGSYECRVQVTAAGDPALALRRRFLGVSNENRECRLAESIVDEFSSARVTEAKFVQLDDLTENVSYEFALRLSQWGRRVDNLLLLRCPWVESFPSIAPLAATSRTQPMLAPSVLAVVESHEIQIAGEFTRCALPSPIAEECPWGSYRSSIAIDGSRLVCEREFRHAGGIVPAERFTDYKHYCEQCRRADDADIVFTLASNRDE